MSQQPLYFITSSRSKYEEAKVFIPELEHMQCDLPEIQEVDAKAVIQTKLQEAFKICPGEFIVEDTSLYLDALNGLPGPLIKWFQQKIGSKGIADLAHLLNNNAATALTCLGYGKNPEEIYFFEGFIKGTITMPRGNNGFGWDSIFIPSGSNETFAELDSFKKNSFSMREKAFRKLQIFLDRA